MKADKENSKSEIPVSVYATDALRYDERGLIPAVVQDIRTGEVLTLAYMNAESLRRTLDEGETWFWSRSRAALWHKGETSGHTQRVVELRLDCDRDALVALVEPAGAACHTGARSCFHNAVDGAPVAGAPSSGSAQIETEPDDAASKAEAVEAAPGRLGMVLEELYRVVESRRREMPPGSYTTYLFEKGLDKILKKVGEESAETIIAAKNPDADALAGEAADLIYHLIVLLVERGTTLDAIAAELARRAGKRKAE